VILTALQEKQKLKRKEREEYIRGYDIQNLDYYLFTYQI
jgi:hypothetical protein